MAVITNQADSKLKVVYLAGVDNDNKNIIKNKTFANVKKTVQNDNLYNFVVAISELQDYELSNIVRYDEYQLLEEV